jgi:mannitol-1-phosphate 5-dehydrogenase
VGKTFVGIGFGPIQSGLFLLEAQQSENFERLVVAEVVPETVTAVRHEGGRVRVNVAHRDRIEVRQIDGIEIHNPLDPSDARKLVAAIAAADEIATALPSIDFYSRGAPSPANLLALGLAQKLADSTLPSAAIYAAENHNHAAEHLRDAVSTLLSVADAAELPNRVAFVNTVIGKMSGVVTDPDQIQRDGLVPLVADVRQAVLVEQFNRISISQIRLADFERGIVVFEEKPDLLPFEEAKLYGHNAAHALFGYLANQRGLTFMHEVDATDLVDFVTAAFVEESGGALVRRHAASDPLFTADGWAEYASDLIERMVNPFLRDRVDRIIRDPRRKLAWDDRLVGTMRLAIQYGITPRRFALGATAAAEHLMAELGEDDLEVLLRNIWPETTRAADESARILALIQEARGDLHTGNLD